MYVYKIDRWIDKLTQFMQMPMYNLDLIIKMSIHILYIYVYVSYLEKVGILATGCRRY